ncbi:hypothetical protein ACFLRY_05645 [Bacteroidota bacterium]
MIINRNNYNEYFLDYWEGRLSDDQKDILYVFLENNQDLNKDFYAFESITLEKDLKINFPNKKQLKKEIINLAEFEEKSIAYHEGDLNELEKSELLSIINDNEALLKIFNSFADLKLNKNLSITFNSKDQLKKTILIPALYRTHLYRGISAAAIIIILLGSYFLIFNQDKPIPSGTEQLSVNIIPVKESILSLNNLPKYQEQDLTYRSTLDPNPISEIDNEDTKIKQLPLKQSLAIKADKNNNHVIIFSRIEYYDDQDLLAYLKPTETKNNKKSLFGRIAGNFGNKVKNLFSPAKELFIAEDNTVFWNIAETGVKGYNLLTNNSYEIVRYMNEEGKTKSIKIIDSDEPSSSLKE